MFKLVLKLQGVEKYLSGSHPYTVYSNTLVNSVADGEALFETLKDNDSIEYTFVSCAEVSHSELIELLGADDTIKSIEFYTPQRMPPQDLINLNKCIVNDIKNNDYLMVRMYLLNGVEYHTLDDSFTCSEFSPALREEVLRDIKKYFTHSTPELEFSILTALESEISKSEFVSLDKVIKIISKAHKETDQNNDFLYSGVIGKTIARTFISTKLGGE